MIFATRQLQEKCIEHNISLYTVFTDLTKAFDSISHDSLWKILAKQGIPDKYIIVLMQLHDGTHGDVWADSQLSDYFPITTGMKQGCVIAPVIFLIFSRAMLN